MKNSMEEKKQQPVVLLSAYGCEPDKGSEGGVGWNWALQLAKGAEVHVVTRKARRPSVEAYLKEHGLKNPRFIYVELPDWTLKYKTSTLGMNIYYMFWQLACWVKCRSLVEELGIDIAHHVSFMSLTRGSFVPFLGVKSVIGPIGGLQTVPKAAKPVMRSRIMESIRSMAVKFFRFNPVGLLTAWKADLLVMANASNQKVMPKAIRDKAVTGLQIGTPIISARPCPELDGPIVFHWSGRFVDHKGLEILIRAVDHLKTNAPSVYRNIRVVVSGSGPLEKFYRKLINELGLAEAFEFLGWVTLAEMNAIWDRSHVFVFTSLRETTGMALQEAMMREVAPIVIDNGGPGEMVTEDSGIKVSGEDFQELVSHLADGMAALAEEPEKGIQMGIKARERALEYYSWDAVGSQMLGLYEALLDGRKPELT
jgi:glycosyltransferase involved in cell wall biosynthesis